MVAPADFRPDEDVVAALIERVDDLVGGPLPARNCLAGPVEAYGSGIPHLAVFVTASGGLPSLALKGNALGETFERRPTVNIRIRSSARGVPRAFEDGQRIAREVFEALHHNPPSTSYCESESLNSQPSYLGRDDDGHHEWVVVVQLIVDVVR
jgi:hypothetical protein